MKKQFLFLTLIMFTITLSAQNSRLIRRADAWFAKNEFRQAALDYEAAIRSAERSRRTPLETKSYLYTRLGETYFFLREYVKAEASFVRARAHGADDLNFLLHYGRALQASDKASEALEVFREALAGNPDNLEVQNAIRSAEFNLASWGDSRVEQHPVSLESALNVSNQQYALAWYEGSLLFSSDRVDTRGRNKNLAMAPTTFFLSRPVYDFNTNRVVWSVPEPIERIESHLEYYVHSFAYDPNTSTYYVQRCLVKSDALDHRCNIYAYRQEANGRMSSPARQSFHHTGANIGHPTLSSDGNVMIFTSTQGGSSSLYIAQKTGRNTWTEPLLLGSGIHTNGEETYPQLFRDSLLFFSSNGHLGMGGLDIFYTEIKVNGVSHSLSAQSDLERLEFTKPVNLGAPINSGADDVSFLLQGDANGGFFISNRTLGGQNRNQIFSFDREPFIFDAPGKHLASRQATHLDPLAGRSVQFVMPDRLDTEKSKINREVAQFNEEVFDLNSEVSKTNAAILALENKKLEKGSDPAKLKAQQDVLFAQNAKHTADIARLNDEIAKRSRDLARLSDRQTPNDRSRLDDAITRQNADITKQNAAVTRQNADFALLNRDMAGVVAPLSAVNKNLEVQQSELSKLHAQTPTTPAEKEKLDSEKARVSGEISKLQAERSRLEGEQSKLVARSNQLNDEGRTANRNLIILNDGMTRLNNDVARLHGEHMQPSLVRFVMPERLDTEKARINREIAHLNEEVFDLNSEVSKNNSEILALENKKLEVGADPAKLKAQQDALFAQNAKHTADIAKLNAEIAQRNRTLSRISEQQTPDDRSRLDDAITRLNADITKQNAAVTKQNSDFALLNRNLAGVIAPLSAINNDLSAQQSELSRLNAQHPTTDADRAKLDADKARVSSEISRLEGEQAKLQGEQSKLMAQGDQLQAQGRNADRNLIALNDDMVRLNHDISRLHGDRMWPLVRFEMPDRTDTEQSRLNLQVARLNKNVFDLNSEVSKNNAEILALQDKKSKRGANVAKLNAQQDALLAQNAKLNADIASLNDEIVKRNADLARVNAGQSPEERSSERSRLDDAITKENAEITNRNAAITKQNSDLALLNRAPNQAQVAGQRQQLQAQDAEANRGLVAANTEIMRLNDEIARLHGERIVRRTDTIFIERIVEVRVEVPVEVFVERNVPGEILVLRRVFFSNNSAVLRPASIKELNEIVEAMHKNPNARLEISGHTDVVGTLSHNQQLSEGRAKAVRDYLIEKGISADRLRYAGYNYSKPIATNATPEGRARNRRVEIKIF